MNQLNYPLSSTDKKILKDIIKESMPSLILDVVWNEYMYYQSFFESLDGYTVFPAPSSPGASPINGTAGGNNAGTIPSGIISLVGVNNLEFSNGITFVAPTFTTLTAGQYLITGQVTYAADSVIGDLFEALIYINGAPVAVATTIAAISNSDISVNVSKIVDLAAPANIQLYTYHNTGSNKLIYNNSVYTFLSVELATTSSSSVTTYPLVGAGGLTMQTAASIGSANAIIKYGGDLTNYNILSWDKQQRFRTAVQLSSIASYNPLTIPPQKSTYGTSGIDAQIIMGLTNTVPLWSSSADGNYSFINAKFLGFEFVDGNIYAIAFKGNAPFTASTIYTKVLLQSYQADVPYLLEIDLLPQEGAIFYVNGKNVGKLSSDVLPTGPKIPLMSTAIETLDANKKQMFVRFYEYIQQK